MADMRQKTTLMQKISKQIFFLTWFFAKRISPSAARRLLYWGVMDHAFVNKYKAPDVLRVEAFGKTLSCPIGIASGFDKELLYNDQLMKNGYFGFSELGTFTYTLDESTQKDVFIPEKKAIVTESEGYPNRGIPTLRKRIIDRRRLPFATGISISSSIEINERQISGAYEFYEQDILKAVQHIAPFCDYISFNLAHIAMPISDLLHNPSQLEILLRKMKEQIIRFAPILTPKFFIKLPCDMSMDVKVLADIFTNAGVDGLIIAGYCDARRMANVLPPKMKPKGYISGLPIRDNTTHMLRKFYGATGGKLMMIACGGVFTGADALEKIKAGASLVQIHTALLYEGPEVVNKINRELAKLLYAKGTKSITEIIGSTAALMDPAGIARAPDIPTAKPINTF